MSNFTTPRSDLSRSASERLQHHEGRGRLSPNGARRNAPDERASDGAAANPGDGFLEMEAADGSEKPPSIRLLLWPSPLGL